MGLFDSDDDKYHWLGGDPADPFSYVPKDDDEGCGCFLFTILIIVVIFWLLTISK